MSDKVWDGEKWVDLAGGSQWDEVEGGLSTDGTATAGADGDFPVTLGAEGENVKWQHPGSSVAGRLNQRANTEIVWSANVNDDDELDDPELPAVKMAIWPDGGQMTFQVSEPGEEWDGETSAKLDLETGEWSFAQLEGDGDRMVVVDDAGVLSTQPIPSGGDGSPESVLHDWVAPHAYLGRAPAGSGTDAAVWRITRITVESDGTVTVGVADPAVWDDRESEDYS